MAEPEIKHLINLHFLFTRNSILPLLQEDLHEHIDEICSVTFFLKNFFKSVDGRADRGLKFYLEWLKRIIRLESPFSWMNSSYFWNFFGNLMSIGSPLSRLRFILKTVSGSA